MAKGLMRHHHEYYEDSVRFYYSKAQHCFVKRVKYRCMICGHETIENYQVSYNPFKNRKKHK